MARSCTEFVQDFVLLLRCQPGDHLFPGLKLRRQVNEVIDAIGEVSRSLVRQLPIGQLLQAEFCIRPDGLRRLKPSAWHEWKACFDFAESVAILDKFHGEEVIDLNRRRNDFLPPADRSTGIPFCKGSGNCCNRAEQDKRIILRWKESPPLPEPRGLLINGVDHQCAPANQLRGLNAALEGVFHQACADPQAGPLRIRRKLPEKEAGNRIGCLPCADRPGQDRRHDSGRRQPVISDHTPCLTNNEDCGEALFLIGEGSRLQPVIECGFPARKFGNVMRCGERFGN